MAVHFSPDVQVAGPLFWGAGVPYFGGPVDPKLQAANAHHFRQAPKAKPGEWCATWTEAGGQDNQRRVRDPEKYTEAGYRSLKAESRRWHGLPDGGYLFKEPKEVLAPQIDSQVEKVVGMFPKAAAEQLELPWLSGAQIDAVKAQAKKLGLLVGSVDAVTLLLVKRNPIDELRKRKTAQLMKLSAEKLRARANKAVGSGWAGSSLELSTASAAAKEDIKSEAIRVLIQVEETKHQSGSFYRFKKDGTADGYFDTELSKLQSMLAKQQPRNPTDKLRTELRLLNTKALLAAGKRVGIGRPAGEKDEKKVREQMIWQILQKQAASVAPLFIDEQDRGFGSSIPLGRGTAARRSGSAHRDGCRCNSCAYSREVVRKLNKVPGHRMHVPSMNRPDGTLVTSDKRGFGSTSATFRGYGVPFVPWAEGDARKMPPPKAEALPIWQFQSSKGTWVPYSAEESKRIEAAKRGGAEVLVVGGCPINLAKMVVVRCPQTVTALRDVTEGEGERLRAGQQVVVLTVEGDGSLIGHAVGHPERIGPLAADLVELVGRKVRNSRMASKDGQKAFIANYKADLAKRTAEKNKNVTPVVWSEEDSMYVPLRSGGDDGMAKGEDMMTTRNFYRFSKGMTEEERRDAAMETIRRRALNNQSVLRRKLKAASYGASGADGEAGGNVDWEVLFHTMDKDGNGTLDREEFRMAVRHCGISQQVITDVEIEVVFGSIDVDGGGDISGEELVAFISGKPVKSIKAFATAKKFANQMVNEARQKMPGKNDQAEEKVAGQAEEEAEMEGEAAAQTALMEQLAAVDAEMARRGLPPTGGGGGGGILKRHVQISDDVWYSDDSFRHAGGAGRPAGLPWDGEPAVAAEEEVVVEAEEEVGNAGGFYGEDGSDGSLDVAELDGNDAGGSGPDDEVDAAIKAVASYSAAGALSSRQHELLDYIDDLYEMAALGLISEQELAERKSSVLNMLEGPEPSLPPPHGDGGDYTAEASALAAIRSETRVEDVIGATPVTVEYGGSDGGGGPVQVRVAAPASGGLKTIRVASALRLPSEDECAELARGIPRGSASLAEEHVLQLVVSLWAGSAVAGGGIEPKVSRAFKALQISGRVQVPMLRRLLKCVIYFDETWGALGTVETSDEAELGVDEFVAACNALSEPLGDDGGYGLFFGLCDELSIDQHDVVNRRAGLPFHQFCAWLALKNVVDFDDFPTIAGGTVVVPALATTAEAGQSTNGLLSQLAGVDAGIEAEEEEATAGKSGWRAVRGSQRSSRLAKSLERLTSYSAPAAEPPSAAAPAAAAPQPYIGDLLDRVAILEKQLALTAHNPPPPQRAVSSLQTAESAHANPGPPRQTTGLGQDPPKPAAKEYVQIVDVEPVVLGMTTYLVDKVNGIAYSNLMGANGEPVEVGRWVPNVAGGPAGKIAFGPGQWYGDAPGTSAAQGPSSVLQPAGPATGRTNVQAVNKLERQGRAAERTAANAAAAAMSLPPPCGGAGYTGRWDAAANRPVERELSGGTGYDFDPDLLAADPEEDEYDGPSDPNLASIEYLANHDLSEWPGWLNKAAGVRQRATQLQSEHLDRQAELTTAPAAPPPSKRSPRTGRRTERPQQPRHSQAKPAAAAGPNKGTGTPSLRMRSRLADGGNPPNGGKFARVQQLKHANGPKRNPGNMSSPGITTSKTLPTGQRQWDGLTDDPAVSDAREAARRRSKAKARALATSVDPIDELKWNVNLAAERQVLAGDPQSWAYLSVEKMRKQQRREAGDIEEDAPQTLGPYQGTYKLKPSGRRGGGGGRRRPQAQPLVAAERAPRAIRFADEGQ